MIGAGDSKIIEKCGGCSTAELWGTPVFKYGDGGFVKIGSLAEKEKNGGCLHYGIVDGVQLW